MIIIDNLEEFQAPWDNCAITLGAFDGLHLGHQSILKRLEKRSHKKNQARVLLTYKPHPDFILEKRKVGKGVELFSYSEKLTLLENYNLDAVIFLPFTLEVAHMTAMHYLKEILIAKLRTTHIIIGYDQRFGKEREGDYAFLKNMKQHYEYEVEQIKAIKYRWQIVSSSNIRQHILDGHLKLANNLLGHPYFMEAKVVQGEQRGRKLGFPTANLKVSQTKVIPAQGIYRGFAKWKGVSYKAMISVGSNPTFQSDAPVSIEAHLLDFNEDLYGQTILLYFQKFLRHQKKFASAEELQRQLERDKKAAMKVKLR